MEYAATSINEQEVVIRLDPASKQAYICSCSAVRSRRLMKLYGPPARVSKNRDGRVTAAFWTLPEKLVGFRRPRKPGSGNPRALARARAARKQARLPRNTLEISKVREPILVGARGKG
jgi:membrane-bound lytic murein transglycosylase